MSYGITRAAILESSPSSEAKGGGEFTPLPFSIPIHEPWSHLDKQGRLDRMIDEAAKRVPRRLMSPKQFDEVKRLRASAEDENTPKPLKRGAYLKRARDLPPPPETGAA